MRANAPKHAFFGINISISISILTSIDCFQIKSEASLGACFAVERRGFGSLSVFASPVSTGVNAGTGEGMVYGVEVLEVAR